MYHFGSASQRRLNTCDYKIQEICNEAIKIINFSVITGHRTKEKQDFLYPKYTKLKWPHGKHNSFPSRAIDIAPYIPPYGAIFGGSTQVDQLSHSQNVSKEKVRAFVHKSYARLIGVIEAVAAQKNIPIRVGMDWDGDFDMLDQDFDDLGHWELR